MLKIFDINSTEDLIRSINELPNNFLYRGQANAEWKLESSLERILNDEWTSERVKKFEEMSLTQFKSKFHLYDKENIKPESKLAWLSLMQHYGVPTRLLDFTESPYVALYFALEYYNPLQKVPLALYALDYATILEKSIEYIKSKDNEFKETKESIYEKQDEIFSNVVDRFRYDIAWVTEPKLLNVRLDRQAGSFLLSGNSNRRIEETLSLDIYKSTDMIKYVIHPDLYVGIFTLLRKMNITSKSLYGDLDGVARGIKMAMQRYSV